MIEGLIIFGLLLLVVAGFIGLGVLLAHDELAGDRAELEAQRQALRAEWTALNQTRRVNDVFFTARDTMRRAEADKRQPHRPDPTVIDGEWS